MADIDAGPVSRVQMPVTLHGLKLAEVVQDVSQGLSMWRVWTALAWQEFKSTYRRSMIGVAWVMLSFAGFIFVKLIIFSSLLETGDARAYNAHLVLGLYIWTYLQQSITAAPDVFVSAQGWIRSEPLPYSLYVCKSIMRQFYNLALTSAVVLAAFIYIGFPVSPSALYSIPALAFLLLNAFSYSMLLGLVSARMRDISHLVKAIMMPMMFLTPIFWLPSQMPGLMKYLWWNPLYHYIEIFRAPLMGGGIPVESWIFSGIVFLIVTSVAFAMFARFKQRIVFWF